VDSQGEEMIWTEWLVAYLEKKIKESELEFSSAVITEAPNYREKLRQRRKEIKALRTQLEPYIPPAGCGIFESIQRLENEAQEYEEILFPLQVQSDDPKAGEPSSSGASTGGSGESAPITETATEFQATSKDTIIIVDEDPILPAQGEGGPTTETETGFQPASQDTDDLVQGKELKEPSSGSGSTASIKLEPISEVDEVPEKELEPFGEEGDTHEVKLEPFSEDEGGENPEGTGLEFFSENEFEEQEVMNYESTESTGFEGDHLTVEQGRSSVKRKHNDDSDDLGTSPKRKI
jgi:hypothetical protein